MNRRDFLKTASAAAVVPAARPAIDTQVASRVSAADDRSIWIGHLRKLADPVLKNLAAGTLKARMPVEQAAGADRRNVTHLEAIGRLLAGHRAVDRAARRTPRAEGRLRARLRAIWPGARSPAPSIRRRPTS